MGEKSKWLLNTVIEARDQYRDEFAAQQQEKGAMDQKSRDTQNAIRAFLELGVDDAHIYQLLDRYFDVDRIAVAAEMVLDIKVQKKLQELKQYLREQGLSTQAQMDYTYQYDPGEQLRCNQEWLKLSPEKIDKKLRGGRK